MKTVESTKTSTLEVPSPSSIPENTLSCSISWATTKRAVILLLSSGVALRAAGLWDNSYLKTAAIGAAIGASYGVYGTLANKEKGENDFHWKEAACYVGAMGMSVSLAYSISVELVFQSLSLLGSVLTTQ